MNTPTGLALYVRSISRSRHGTPKQLAKRLADHGLGWVAIGGPWHDQRGNRLINSVDEVRRYSDACAREGVQPYVWGYPWQGSEELFADRMAACSRDHGLVLLDPELGSNPTRSTRPGPMRRAEDHARAVVEGVRERGARVVGLSTFGLVVRGQRWFPLEAFLAAGVDFAGGQTYTSNRHVDASMDMFAEAIDGRGIALVPNFGTYSFVKRDASKPLRGSNRRAVSKTPAELHAHLAEFVDSPHAVTAMIGWAENFVTKGQWAELARFAEWMHRGACVLPAAQ